MRSKEDLMKDEKWRNNSGALAKIDASKAQAIRSKGGKAAKLAYDRKKLLKDLMLEALEMQDSTTEETNAVAIVMAQIERAKSTSDGASKAFEVIRDTIGQKPSENVSMQVELPEFVDDLKE